LLGICARLVIVPALVAVGLLAGPVPVKIFPADCTAASCTSSVACLTTDRASLAFWRARCDEFAEAKGWVHGVFRPDQAATRFCPVDSQAYVCEGVGAVVYSGFCGGIAGFPCAEGYQCVDDPRDDCDPNAGGADCGGICVRPR
jgi:hypothetical protein